MRAYEFITESKFKKLHGLTVQSLQSFVQSDNKELEEAMLGAPTRKMSDAEMQEYLGRVKTDSKNKTDKYELPYVHGSNIEIKNENGQDYDLEKLKDSIMQRPSKLLKQNEKMQHSDGSSSVFFNIGLPALKGLAVNEETGEFVVVDTCPGAGACKTFCYAMKGSYIMFKAVSMQQTRTLNFLLNDPDSFASVLNAEIMLAVSKNRKSKVIVRWHDAGDFFSPEYLDVAYNVAKANPNVEFYAYTKMADVATAAKPDNFRMNFSQGAQPSQEKQIDFGKTKHSRVVPRDLFTDLIMKDGNKLVKGPRGEMQFASNEDYATFKQRMALQFKLDPKTIITYDQMMDMPVGKTQTWNVIVKPGDGDDSANRPDVLGTYLLIH